jgi:hypothetical protein
MITINDHPTYCEILTRPLSMIYCGIAADHPCGLLSWASAAVSPLALASAIWWIRWAASTGKIHREKARTPEAAGILHRKRKAEALRQKRLPQSFRSRAGTISDLAALARQH